MTTESPGRDTCPSKVSPSRESTMGSTTDLDRARREKKPFFYCRIVANHPIKCFVITLLCHFAMMIISGILLGSGFNLFPTNFEKLPMELYDIPYRLRDYAWRDRNDYDNRFKRTLSNQGFVTYERGLYAVYSSVDLYYDTDGGNVFTKSNLQRMQTIENELASSASFSPICMTYNSSLVCKPFQSILRYFDGTYKHISATLDDPNFNNIPGVLYEAFTNNDTKSDFLFFLPKGYSLSATHAHGTLTRSIMAAGCSISGTTKCALKTWRTETLVHLKKIKTILEKHVDDSTDDFKFYFHSLNLWLSDVLRQAIMDMLCAVGSMLFIFCFMLFHTRSFWIAGWAIISILLSFLGTNIIYTGIIDFQYFGFFHILSIFIILGIGADDLFVFYDNWRLTGFSSYPSLAHRLSDTYSKSVLSMLITSLTTSVAFFSSAISPLLATRSFGVFSGLLVIYNYLSVIIFFPTVVTVYHLKYEQWTCPCCRKCKKKENPSEKEIKGNSNEVYVITEVEMTVNEKESPTEDYPVVNITVNGVPIPNVKEKSIVMNGHSNGHISNGKAVMSNGSANGNIANGNVIANGKPKSAHGSGKHEKDAMMIKALHKKKQKKLVVFFRDYYCRFVTHKITRCVALPIFAIIVGVFAYSASTLEPDNEQLQIYKKSHFYTQAMDKELYSFVQNVDDNLLTVNIVWGLSLKDRSDCHFSSIDCRGTQMYDASFDPNPVANQQALKDFCDFFYNMTSSDISKYNIKTDTSGNPEVACFTRDLETYLKSLSIGGLDLSLPWDSTKTLAFMNAQTSFYDTSGFSSYPHFLSIPMQYWMYNGYSGNFTADYGMYNDLFGEENSTYSTALKTDSSIFYGNKLKYLAVSVNTTINRRTTGYSKGIPIVQQWEELVNNRMSMMPAGVNNGFQLTRDSWHWFYVLKSLADNALLGILIGVGLAFPILSLSTMNVLIGFLATLSICCTTVCVIGVIPLAGWKLGLLTSLNMCLVVGLAVDYVVHLAEGYTLSLHTDRYSRTRDMLEEMGPSVFSGACTTLGASLFMFAAEIQFFMQFGVFMFCTIGFSLIFSLGLFTLLVGLIGPQGNTGNLKVLFRKCKEKLLKRGSGKTS